MVRCASACGAGGIWKSMQELNVMIGLGVCEIIKRNGEMHYIVGPKICVGT